MLTGIGLALGWTCFAVAAFYAMRGHGLDRRLQAFRAPSQPPSAYAFVPLRWREELYTIEGHDLLTQTWSSFRSMIGFAVFGMVLIGAFS